MVDIEMTYVEILRDPMIRQLRSADHVSLTDFESVLREAANRQQIEGEDSRPQRLALSDAGRAKTTRD